MTEVSRGQISAWRSSISERSDRDAQRIARTEYIIEATNDEQFALWWRYHEHYRVPWQEDNMGLMKTIATVIVCDAGPRETAGFKSDSFPIVAQVFWAKLGPAWIAFLSSTSLIEHHGLLEAWRDAVFPCTKAKHHWHSDVANFAHIIHDIEDRYHVQLLDQVMTERVWHLDNQPPPFSDAQAAVEWCDRKVDEWAARRDYFNRKLNDKTAIVFPRNASRIVKARCALCDDDGKVTLTDGVGGKWQEPCQQCQGKRFVEVIL